MKICTALSILLIPGLLATGIASQVCAAERQVRYGVESVGNHKAVLSLNGQHLQSITTSMGKAGKQLRVSAAGVNFQPVTKPADNDPFVKSIRQVRRGAISDILITFAAKVELSQSPVSKNSLKLYISSVTGRPAASASNSCNQELAKLKQEVEDLRAEISRLKQQSSQTKKKED